MFQIKDAEKIKTHFMFSNFFFENRVVFFENRVVYEIMWKNTAEPERPQMTIWHTRFACWITKATDTHSKDVILTALPMQQSVHHRASLLRYTYTACSRRDSYNR
jgi:hypothetical protein